MKHRRIATWVAVMSPESDTAAVIAIRHGRFEHRAVIGALHRRGAACRRFLLTAALHRVTCSPGKNSWNARDRHNSPRRCGAQAPNEPFMRLTRDPCARRKRNVAHKENQANAVRHRSLANLRSGMRPRQLYQGGKQGKSHPISGESAYQTS